MKENSAVYLRLVLVNFIILFFLTGCASRQLRLTETGFLSSYSDLKEEENSGGMYVYRNPGKSINGHYSKIIIAPVQFKLDSTVNANKLKDKEREEMAEYFYEQLEERLKENYVITDTPGSDVLIFRTAITNIVSNIGILNINLISLFSGTGLGGASLEAELVDSTTGERMMAFVDARKGRKFKNGFEKWGHVEEALRFWAETMAMNLNQMKWKNL